MPGFGLRLQLTPPQVGPLDYRGLPRILSLTGVTGDLPERALYVGAGDAKRRLARTSWHDLFTGTVNGEPEYCLAAFAEYLVEDDRARGHVRKAALAEPWVDTLVVDTRPGWPSHAEVVARAMWVERKKHLPEVQVTPPAAQPAQARP